MKLFKKRVEEAPAVDTSAASGEDMAADLDAVMRKYDRESNTRIWDGPLRWITGGLMAAFSLYCIAMTLWSTALPETRLSLFLACIVFIGFLTYPIKKGHVKVNFMPWYDIVLMLVGTGCFLYFAFNAMTLIKLATRIEPIHVVIGAVGILILLELCSRCVGLPILCVVGVLLAVKLGYKGTPGKFDWKNLGVCTLRALPSLSLIIVVIGGIIGGVFSATEGSAIAVVYALVLAFCYRSINLKSLWKIIVDSAKMSGMVVFLVGVSNILGWVMAFLQIPDAVAAALLSLTSNKYIILLIMNVILLVSGTFMDVTPAILIFTPLFLPICQSFGMSTFQFGLILVYNLCIGNITPPVGNALFVGIKVGRTSLSKVMPYMLMYYVAIIGGLLLVTFIPAVSTALPQAMGLM